MAIAGVTPPLPQALLGVDVTGPGASTVRIAPPERGLRQARGTVWTERGPVSVAWARSGQGLTVTVTVPVNVTATVALPGGEPVTVGSGTSTFRQR